MSKKPNILLLMTDQQRWDSVGPNSGWVRTPNIDRIASEGVLFSNAITNSPVCQPARIALSRGLYPHNTGVWENASLSKDMPKPTWVQSVRAAGYRTSIIGKTHLHGHPKNEEQWLKMIEDVKEMGLDDNMECGGEKADTVFYGEFTRELEKKGMWDAFREHFKNTGGEDGDVKVVPFKLPIEYYGDYWIGKRAQKYLEEYNRSEPWFCWVSFGGPHTPYDAPEPYASMYNPKDMPKPMPRYEWASSLPPTFLKRVMEKYPFMSEEISGPARANYAGKITQIDDRIGEILKTIEKRGELDNTVIIFTSDHGSLNGDFGMSNKRCFFDGSVRVPMIVRTPETARSGGGKISDALCEWFDVGPTCVEYAGGKIEHQQFARSLAPSVANSKAEHRSEAVCEYHGEQMILTKEWKMAVNKDGTPYLLFDVKKDPREANNLAGKPEYASVEKELALRLYNHLLANQVQILNYWK